ncbi:hypothetical protein CHS0354_019518 [Potamilus streckersoni]|uniref:Novel STAND NTPase 3 domain-containing protein n=1 Tax=Potamilus streckersoni TaxID=2493646 RepID=A0AAE0SGZ0_9BIVA|nr:hypothetical protein CHS0354_019518 [Potamilus streckersoni]
MADNSDIRPLIVSTAEQWRTLVDSSATLCVIFDDLCGRFCVNEELKQWREESMYMPGLIENGKHVVIFTMKSHLQEKILEAREPISSSEEMTLELDTISLTLAERKEFAIRYLNKFNLNEAEDESEVLEKTTENNILILQPSCQATLINRFITALRGSNPKDFTIISEANVCSSKDFRNAFIAECKEVHYLAETDENSLLVHAVNANNHDLVEELLHELDNISEDKMESVSPFLTKSAKSSCAHKDTNLLEKICAKCHLDANDILPNIIEQILWMQ